MVKKYGLFIIILLVIIQFRQIDKSNPEYNIKQSIENTSAISQKHFITIKNSCFDCHSYTTRYPWYTNIAPLSWWIKGHIDHGREKLNFSVWGSYNEGKQSHKLEECIELLENKSMPLTSYTWLHPESRLSKSERQDLIDHLKTL